MTGLIDSPIPNNVLLVPLRDRASGSGSGIGSRIGRKTVVSRIWSEAGALGLTKAGRRFRENKAKWAPGDE